MFFFPYRDKASLDMLAINTHQQKSGNKVMEVKSTRMYLERK